MSAAEQLQGTTTAQAEEILLRCCGSSRWAQAVAARRPFADMQALRLAAGEAWARVQPSDVLEALSHHPEIGTDLALLRQKFATTASWAEGEQGQLKAADEATLLALRAGNVRYKAKFGHIFVVCATGKSAAEMLALLQARLPNTAEVELWIAAGEQAKITSIRLEKL